MARRTGGDRRRARSGLGGGVAVSRFVEECRREWKRLNVPETIAEEMAADLSADLEEAEAEGSSIEDVLGSSALDPRAFAATWAAERGVSRAPAPPPSRRWLTVAALAATTVAVAGILMLLAPRPRAHLASTGGAPAVVVQLPAPRPPAGFATHAQAIAGHLHTAGLLVLALGILAMIATSWVWRSRSPGSPGYSPSAV